MLEVKNLKKVYKTKKGADVFALDGVTLKFNETGMVFLLGKSGSGKSTLLNLCGGLDAPTEGEIIVKGRSSKDFSQSDFDSYRNTFIGFIFQEYNILNEFSVEDNIALALELQGKPKDKNSIQALLDEVDLTGLAKRKPNTLSGGQKQRIAIARALIKTPEIIMADEPTGALDSKTGKQVFDTLKKLSKTKLVIVVSHDRDFAEQYGDRIIELKDGKVLSDISKTQIAQEAISENVNTLGDVLCVKKGSALTVKDIEKINEFLKSKDEDIIIAANKKDVENFKKASRINDNNEKEVFLNTDESKHPVKQYTKEDSRFIRSKLPLKHAFKIGASGLKTKPFRLFFTVLLCTIAFVFFSLLSTLNFYDSEATFKQTLQDANVPVLKLQKLYQVTYKNYSNGKLSYEYESFATTRFTQDDLEQYQQSLCSNAFGGIGSYASFSVRQSGLNYWKNNISAFAFLPEENLLRQSINGTYPSNDKEIVISSYFADLLVACNAYDNAGASIEVTSPSDLIGKTIPINNYSYKITGILDSGIIPDKFAPLNTPEGAELYSLDRDFEAYLEDSLHLLVFVTESRLKVLETENYDYKDKISNYTYIVASSELNGEVSFPDYSNCTYDKFSNINKPVVSILSSEISDGQVMVPSNMFASIIRDHLYILAENQPDTDSGKDKQSELYALTEKANLVDMGGTYVYPEDKNGKEEFVPLTDAQLQQYINELINVAKHYNIPLTITVKLFDQNNQSAVGDQYTFTIAGVILSNSRYYYDNSIGLSENDFNALWDIQKLSIEYYSESISIYKEPANALYTQIFLPFEYSHAVVDNYWNIYNNKGFDENGTRASLTGSFIMNLQMIDSTVVSLSQVFLYVGLVLAVFAILLFSNFITVSISQKTREIGILRAVGARSTDVFKIFFSESFVISAICIVLSTALSMLACHYINVSLASQLGVSLFVFGPISFIILVAIALVTAVIATFLPVYRAARRKPVDSIRSL